MYFPSVSKKEVIDTISNLKSSTSCGTDDISSFIIKNISDAIIDPLTHVINLSFNSGKFPDTLKTATILPIFKKGDKLDCKNYRPISLLCTFSKIIEKIACNRLISYLDSKSVLSSCQHGYRRNKSTESATYEFLQEVHRCLDNNLLTVGLFFDLSQAFDSINLDFIEIKLIHIGIRGIFLEWIMSYLRYRKLRVKLKNVVSSDHIFNIGVPQGSIVGPLIFLLFVNDLPDHVKSAFLTAYVDDSSFIVFALTLDELVRLVNQTISSFDAWCRQNQLILNINKTEVMFFSKRRPAPLELINELKNHNLNLSSKVKFLGLMLDNKLSWEPHIDGVCAKLNSAYFAMWQLKDKLSVQSLLSVYYSLAYSHMKYNVIAWGMAATSQRVFICQKRILRLMFNMQPCTSCKPVFIQHKMLTFPSLLIYNCVIDVKKFPEKYTDNSNHSFQTRYKNLLKTNKHYTATYEKSPLYLCTKLYNKLPINIKTITNINVFKNRTKFLLTSKGYYSINEYLNDVIVMP